MKKFFAIFLLATLASVTIINTAFAEIMLFVGDGCPHCENVEAYMTENNILQKLPVTVYEVWKHPENQSLFLQKTQEVGYEGQGVPFMVDGNHYEVGDYPIIGYFSDLLEKRGDPMIEKIKADSVPVAKEVTVTPEDSKDLNEIMEEKTADGEKSELVDPSTLYDAANGLDKDEKPVEKTSEPANLNSPILYVGGTLILLILVAGIYSTKKRKGKKRR